MDDRSTAGRRTRRNLIIFTFLVLLSGWVGRAVDVFTGSQGESLGTLIWIVAPAATVLLLRAFAGDGWRDLGLWPALRGNIGWYLLALAVYPVVGALVMMVGGGLGWISFSGFAAWPLLDAFVLALAPNFVKNIFEEIAWRGHLTPKIHSLGINDLLGHCIVGLIWGLWHLPYFLYFLDRSVLQGYTSLSLPVFVVLAVASMVSWAIVYGEIRLLTGSVWPAVLMHMVEDSFINELLLEGHVRIQPGTDWLLSPGVGLLNTALFVTIGVGLYRVRMARRVDVTVGGSGG